LGPLWGLRQGQNASLTLNNNIRIPISQVVFRAITFNAMLLFLMNMGLTQLEILKEDLDNIFGYLHIGSDGQLYSSKDNQRKDIWDFLF